MADQWMCCRAVMVRAAGVAVVWPCDASARDGEGDGDRAPLQSEVLETTLYIHHDFSPLRANNIRVRRAFSPNCSAQSGPM